MPPQIQITPLQKIQFPPFSTFAKSFKATSHAPPEFGDVSWRWMGNFRPDLLKKGGFHSNIAPSSSFLVEGKTQKTSFSIEVLWGKKILPVHIWESRDFFNKLRLPSGLASSKYWKKIKFHTHESLNTIKASWGIFVDNSNWNWKTIWASVFSFQKIPTTRETEVKVT